MGISIFLLAVGAILYFAVTQTVSGVSLSTVGVVLMIVGGIGVLASIVAMSAARGPDRTVVREDHYSDV
jgi:hypothetical protein